MKKDFLYNHKKLFLFSFLFVAFNMLGKSRAFGQIIISSAQEASDFAIGHSKTLKLQRLSLEAAAKSSRLAISSFLPRFDFSLNENDTVKIGGADSRNKSITANVTQMIFDGGKAKITYDMNNAESFYNLKLYEIELNKLRSNVINSYYVIIQLQKQIDIQEQLEANAKTQLDIMRKETDLGLTLENDYLEYLISFRKIQDELKQYKRELRTKERTFKILIGLDLESEISVSEDYSEEQEMLPYLEEKSSRLWTILKNNSPTIKKSQTALYYAQQQYNYSNRVYCPTVSFNGGVSFSGTQYPLGNPSFSASMIFSFDNNPLIPMSFQNGYDFNKNQLSAVKNTASLSLSPQPGYISEKRSEKIALNSKKENMKDEETSLYEDLFSKIASYDDCIDTVLRTQETIELQQRRLIVSKEQVEKGLMKKIDYLKILQQQAQQEISLMQAEVSMKSIVRELEISLCIPFGGLKECL